MTHKTPNIRQGKDNLKRQLTATSNRHRRRTEAYIKDKREKKIFENRMKEFKPQLQQKEIQRGQRKRNTLRPLRLEKNAEDPNTPSIPTGKSQLTNKLQTKTATR